MQQKEKKCQLVNDVWMLDDVQSASSISFFAIISNTYNVDITLNTNDFMTY